MKKVRENTPAIDEKSIIYQTTSFVKGKITTIFSWMDKKEGKIIVKAISSLASFAVGDPTGMVFPLLIECADYGVRKRFLKHFPDLMKRLENEKGRIDQEFVKTETGQQILRDTLREIIRQSDEEKIEALKSFLVSSYLHTNHDELLLKRYHKILLQMDLTHIRILAAFTDPEEVIRQIMKNKNDRHPQLFIPIDFNKYYLKLPEVIFSSAFLELKNWGLIEHKSPSDDVDNVIYTMQESYWGKYQVAKNISKERIHSYSFYEKAFAEGRIYGTNEKITLALSCLCLNFITNFGWDLTQLIKNS